jgi:pantetheine-phosphate adenylyltransferase
VEKEFEVAAVGGTFDEFHKGHRFLLKKAFEVGNHVLIGLCSDDFVKRLRKPHKVLPYETRLEDLKSFLRSLGVLERAEIIPLNDPYGVTVSRNPIDAIVVSKETESRAREINEKRKSKGMSPLKIVVIDMVLAEDYFPIASTRIWLGEIDQEGHLVKISRR